MKLVIALGGNALLRRGQPLDPNLQRDNVISAASYLAPVIKQHSVVITHGNGPQVGLLALQTLAYSQLHPQQQSFPLDVLGAETEGMIGYLLEQELMNQLRDHPIATLLTQIAIDPHDPAFTHPSKPIGPQYTEQDAEKFKSLNGWSMARDGDRWRRVVASPAPRKIMALATIKLLIEHQTTVICAGGGGIPVAIREDGSIQGVEAVIDKDLASELLAREILADALVMLTDVPSVMIDYQTPHQRAIGRATPRALSKYTFAAGSMAPKVAAAILMARSGKRAAIGAISELGAITQCVAGTWVLPDEEVDGDGIEFY
jgi:carbamate kinase